MKIKHFISTGIVVLSSLGISSYSAKATLRSKITNTVRGILNIHTLGANLKIPPNLKEQTNKLITNGEITGSTPGEFDYSKLSMLTSSYYYHQSLDAEGTQVTLISKTLPKIKDIQDSSVKIKYMDENGIKKISETQGIPIWVSGIDMQENYKSKIKELETVNPSSKDKKTLSNKLVDVMSKFKSSKYEKLPKEETLPKETKLDTISSTYITIPKDTPSLSYDITKELDRLSNENNLIGMDYNNFDFTDLPNLNLKYYYYQNKDDNGFVTTLISKTIPEIVNIDGNKITVRFKNHNGEIVNMVTEGIPRWLSGNKLFSQNETKINLVSAEIKAERSSQYRTLLDPEEDTNTDSDLSHLGAAATRSNLGLINYGFDDDSDSDEITSIKDK